ncbi:MAG: hypothetical protein ACFFD4_18745 [Candidatus Odinarchaeota archaeon]
MGTEYPFLTPPVPDLGTHQNYFEFWNRLEPINRSEDYVKQSIQVQIRDPLWMLARQWQYGEFQSEDAGSPVKTTLRKKITRLTRMKLTSIDDRETSGSSNQTMPITYELPLETFIERERAFQNTSSPNWRTCVQIGQQFEREIKKLDGKAITDSTGIEIHIASTALIESFRKHPLLEVKLGNIENEMLDDSSRSFLGALSGRALDGKALLELTDVQFNSILSTNYDSAIIDEVRNVAFANLKQWYLKLYSEPKSANKATWRPERLEYEFAISAPHLDQQNEQIILAARDYNGKHLDWYNFSIHHDENQRLGSENNAAAPYTATETNIPSILNLEEYIPQELIVSGMPNHRWWEFEDRLTDFGDLEVDTVDLSKMLLMEFALIQSNDWFIIPVDLEVGSLCKICDLNVSNVFGEIIPINSARKEDLDRNLNFWDMFSISKESGKNIDKANPCSSLITGNFLFLPPSLGWREESRPIEEVRFLRDEMANMAWGVEYTIANYLGEPVSGYEAFQNRLQREKQQRYISAINDFNIANLAVGLETKALDKAIEGIRTIAQDKGINTILSIINDGNLANKVKIRKSEENSASLAINQHTVIKQITAEINDDTIFLPQKIDTVKTLSDTNSLVMILGIIETSNLMALNQILVTIADNTLALAAKINEIDTINDKNLGKISIIFETSKLLALKQILDIIASVSTPVDKIDDIKTVAADNSLGTIIEITQDSGLLNDGKITNIDQEAENMAKNALASIQVEAENMAKNVLASIQVEAKSIAIKSSPVLEEIINLSEDSQILTVISLGESTDRAKNALTVDALSTHISNIVHLVIELEITNELKTEIIAVQNASIDYLIKIPEIAGTIPRSTRIGQIKTLITNNVLSASEKINLIKKVAGGYEFDKIVDITNDNNLIPDAKITSIKQETERMESTKETTIASFPKYRIASVPPGNWIPFVPVHIDQTNRSIILKKAKIVENPPAPRTSLLRNTIRVNEETVSRAGFKVDLDVQRTRWIDGSTPVWFGRKTGPGTGEGSSGLKFDYLENDK